MTDAPDDASPAPPSAGVVLEQDRGSLPFALIHGEALVAAAAWALGEAGIDIVDQTVPWAAVAEQQVPLVLHDPLCPMTPPAFLARCAAVAAEDGVVAVGVRPVTDTVKAVTDGRLGATLDRDSLVTVCSPVVLPPSVVADLDDLPATDLAELAAWLRQRYDVALVEAPPEARRVRDEDDVRFLERLTDPR